MEKIATLRCLQLVRCFACGIVVYYHTHSGYDFGQFGVDLFFVLSGFVIFLVMEQGKVSVVEFMGERITRIFPLYFLLTTALLIITLARPSLLEHTRFSLLNYFRSIFFIPYYKETGALHPMLGIGWSLNYEMLFYVLSACVIALQPISGRTRIALLSSLILSSMAVGHLLSPNLSGHEFLGNSLMLEFLIGASVYAALPTILRRADYYGPRAALFLAGLLFLAMAGIELYAPVDFGYSGSRWFFFGIPAGLLLICMRVAEPVLRRAGASLQVLCFLGDASYATYLSHIYVIQFVSKLVPSSDWIGRMHLRGPLMILLATGIGALLYMFVDRPVLKYVRKVLNPIYRRESRQEGFAVPLGSQV